MLSLAGEKNMPGGAANVARNLAHLGCRVDLIGVTGKDNDAEALRHALDGGNIDQVACGYRPQPSDHNQIALTAASQQVLRVDHESTVPVAENIAARLLKAAERCLKSGYPHHFGL